MNLRGVPILNSVALTTPNSLVTLDSERRLQSFGLCPNLLCLSRHDAYVGEAGSDAYVSWGRWKAGEIKLHTLGISTEVTLNANQGLHYLVGVPTAVMPTSGSFSYSLTGSTYATTSDGSVAPGALNAAAQVQFASGTATRVGLQGSVNFTNTTLIFSSNGGIANPAASNLTMTSPNTFNGSLQTQQSGAALLNCGGAGCATQVRGGFFGPDAARMGIDYSIVGGTGNGRTINGVGVLTKQ